ncbi:PIN-like domain-containing protein [Daejeonella sp.]|uniref:PIN-like domain-containing protein n=1 Tax=Daejeonella sp. TaxID=2805397 RepID=UPI0025C0DCA3|nr:PIN-like domain-containing protein [Daejeonella sp.]
MKFPLAVIDKTEYLKKISALLEDDECQIFIDTNIFGLFFRVYSSARKEFFDWIVPLIEKKRVNTPLWASNEYSNRFIRNQIDDYFSPLKKVNTTQKEFKEISSFLKMNIDSKSLYGTTYNNVEEYQNDLKEIEEKLKKVSGAGKANAKDETYKYIVHAEIQNVFEKTIIQSDLNSILKYISEYGQVRYNHKLPPGFEDEKKELNLFGDLIIWLEILEFCKATNSKKAILITNDNKKDWVYAPNKILDNSKFLPNNDPQFKVVDPRLTFEFKNITTSEEFHIINFESLTQILINKSQVGFIELAKALQIASLQETKVSEDIETNNEEVILDEDITKDKIEIAESVEKSKNEIYSEYALADFYFPTNDSSIASETIENLKSYNWYVQNPALEKFLKVDLSETKENQNNKDKLFVIGRNIYQSACGGSGTAIDIIENLRKTFTKYKDFVINHLYSGMLYEIYFNSHNKFRENNFKSTFINQIFDLQDNMRLKDSIEFIIEKLQPFKDKLVVLPSQEPKTIEIQIGYEEKEDTNLDFLGIDNKFHSISDISINGHSIITNKEEEAIERYYTINGSQEDVVELLSVTYLIPTKQMNLTLNPKSVEQIILKLEEPKKLKKLAITGVLR